MSENFEIQAKIISKNEEEQIVFGWASVVTEKGVPIVDRQGDVISVKELAKAAREFMSEARMAKMMHKGESVGEIVESIVLSKDVQQALGVSLDVEGWFIGMKINDDSVWKRVKTGELKAFSIGGTGTRTPV